MKFLLVLAALVLAHASLVWTQACICENKYEPVCGRDMRTYPNECSIKCARIEIAHLGECRRRGAFYNRH